MQLGPVYRRLTEAGLRLTPQRDAILQTLVDQREKPTSAEDVWNAMREGRSRPVGLATVYRTLDLLQRLGVVEREAAADGRSLYRLSPELFQGRYQLICTRCGEVMERQAEWLETLAGRIEAETDFRAFEPELKVYGVCGSCALASRREVWA
jgi:Fur family ferric uptake transcriptional regulator